MAVCPAYATKLDQQFSAVQMSWSWHIELHNYQHQLLRERYTRTFGTAAVQEAERYRCLLSSTNSTSYGIYFTLYSLSIDSSPSRQSENGKIGILLFQIDDCSP